MFLRTLFEFCVALRATPRNCASVYNIMLLQQCGALPEDHILPGAWLPRDHAPYSVPSNEETNTLFHNGEWTGRNFNMAGLWACKPTGGSSSNKSAKPRPLYSWIPRRCTLPDLDARDVCASGVFGRSALFVGDSTMVQLFASIVLSLGGTFSQSGEPLALAHARTVATICGGSVRLSFVRSEQLIWASPTTDGVPPSHQSIFSKLGRCFGTRNEPFVQQAARYADVRAAYTLRAAFTVQPSVPGLRSWTLPHLYSALEPSTRAQHAHDPSNRYFLL